eukprot:2578650-Pleurochrysis_carterae.AAC.1
MCSRSWTLATTGCTTLANLAAHFLPNAKTRTRSKMTKPYASVPTRNDRSGRTRLKKTGQPSMARAAIVAASTGTGTDPGNQRRPPPRAPKAAL